MTYREKFMIEHPDDGDPAIDPLGCPFDHFENAKGCPAYAELLTCAECWNRETPEDTTQEDMMAVLGDMTKAQAKFAIEWLWNKYFKEDKT